MSFFAYWFLLKVNLCQKFYNLIDTLWYFQLIRLQFKSQLLNYQKNAKAR